MTSMTESPLTQEELNEMANMIHKFLYDNDKVHESSKALMENIMMRMGVVE